jgi:hypothetical protein
VLGKDHRSAIRFVHIECWIRIGIHRHLADASDLLEGQDVGDRSGVVPDVADVCERTHLVRELGFSSVGL